eukprot:3897951-Pyramimonas_sp.AAC.1
MVVWFWLHMDEDVVDDQIQYREVRTVDARWSTTSQLCNSVNKFKGGYKMRELAVKKARVGEPVRHHLAAYLA